MTLDNRLTALARWVLPGQVMADVGTDHAYLPCYLVEQGICPAAIASDVASGPFERARRTVAEQGLSEQIELRLGSGLSVLRPNEAATIVLSGMGGQLICQLLQAKEAVVASAQRLILQPQRNPELVRRWLADHGQRIIGDDLARDGKMWYNIIVSQPGQMETDQDHLLYGLVTDGVDLSLRQEWLCCHRDALQDLMDKLKISRGETARTRFAQLEEEAGRLERLIAEVKLC